MNDGTRAMRRPRRAGPPTARTAAAIIATAALSLLAAACGGGSPSSTGSGGSPSAEGSTSSPSGVGYSRCMRTHKVPNYPDPDGSGTLPKTSAQQLGVSSSAFNAAQRACQHLLPNNTGGSFDQQVRQCYLAGVCPPALVQRMLTVGRKFALCMRNHGVPNWPDPTLDSEGKPFFNLSSHGFTRSEWHSSQMRAKGDECARVAGGGLATG